LTIRFISSLTPSHKSTLWDTNPGSQTIKARLNGWAFIVSKGYKYVERFGLFIIISKVIETV
jgi:hypothetical protein